jgi:hypothetical protein
MSAPPAAAASSEGPAATASGRLCGSCKEYRPNEAFSKTQLKLAASARKCTLCQETIQYQAQLTGKLKELQKWVAQLTAFLTAHDREEVQMDLKELIGRVVSKTRGQRLNVCAVFRRSSSPRSSFRLLVPVFAHL